MGKNTNLIGTIPPFLGNLEKLKLLDIDRNNLVGSIPLELSYIYSLKFLLLNRNNLTGTLPVQFSSLSIIMLLVDKNSITGDMSFICDGYRRDLVIADCGGE